MQLAIVNSVCYNFKYYWIKLGFHLCPLQSSRIDLGGIFMTKGQIESKLSEAISKFEIEQMGRGPEKIRTVIFQDLIIFRLTGFLSISEKNLAQNKDGVELIKKVRTALFESARKELEAAIKSVIDVEIISTYSDVSTKTGERIIAVVVDRNLEENKTK